LDFDGSRLAGACFRILGLLIVMLVTIDVAIWHSGLFQRRYPQVSLQAVGRAGGNLAVARRFRPRLAFIGNSRTGFAIRPTRFDQVLGERRIDRPSCNLALGGATPQLWHLLMKKVIADRPELRPSALVIGLTPNELLQSTQEFAGPDLYGLITWPQDVMPADIGWEACLSIGLGYPWQLWRFRHICNQIVTEKSTLLLGGSLQPGGRPSGDSPAFKQVDYAADSARGFEPGIAKPHLAFASPLIWPNDTLPPQDLPLRQLIALCRTHRIAVFVALMPEWRHPADGHLEQRLMHYARSLDADRLVNLRTVCASSRYWQDWMHLNPAGANLVTHHLATTLREPIRHALQ
jgi:hypothetical protein